jgi:hypothetical protein
MSADSPYAETTDAAPPSDAPASETDADSAVDSEENLSESQPDQVDENTEDDADRVLDEEEPVDGSSSTLVTPDKPADISGDDVPWEEDRETEPYELQDGIDAEDQELSNPATDEQLGENPAGAPAADSADGDDSGAH